MDKEALLAFLKENLTIEAEHHEAMSYYDDSKITVVLKLDGETISTAVARMPTYERAKDNGY